MRKIVSCEFNLDTACVASGGWDAALYRLYRRGERGGEQYVLAVGAGLTDLQRFAGLRRTNYEQTGFKKPD